METTKTTIAELANILYGTIGLKDMNSNDSNKIYCNRCQMLVKSTRWQGEQVCPYHQYTMRTEDGIEFMYDEFDQDGE